MNKLLVGACILGTALAFPQGGPPGPGAPGPLPIPGADGYGKQDGYFQYINVPKHKQYEWGYRRGNENHNREQYLSLKDQVLTTEISCWQAPADNPVRCTCPGHTNLAE